MSAIGPKPSMVKAVVKVASIPNAAKEMPYMLARLNEMKIVIAIHRTGTTVER